MDLKTLRAQTPEYAQLDDLSVVKAEALMYPDAKVEDIARALGVALPTPPAPPRTIGGFLKDTGISALKGAIAVPEAAVGLADLATGGQVGRAAQGLGFRPAEAKQFLDEQYSDPQKAAFKAIQDANGFVDTAAAVLTNPSTIAHSIVESLPAMGAGGVLGRAVMGLGLTSPVVAGAIGEGTIMAGSAAEQIRQQTKDGLLTGEQSGLAGATGAGSAGLAMLGAGVASGMPGVGNALKAMGFQRMGEKVAKGMGIHDIDTMIAAGKAHPGAEKGLIRSILEGAFTEGVLEELPQSVLEQVLQNKALDRPLEEGVDKAAVMGLLAGGAMGAGAQAVGRMGKPAPAGVSDVVQREDGTYVVTPPADSGVPQQQVIPQPDGSATASPAKGPLENAAAAASSPEPGSTLPNREEAGGMAEAVQKLVEYEVKTRPDPDAVLEKMHRMAEQELQATREFERKPTLAPAAEGDTLAPDGKPFISKARAVRAAGTKPGSVEQVDGGWVFRPTAESKQNLDGAQIDSAPSEDERLAGKRAIYAAHKDVANGSDEIAANRVENAQAKTNELGAPMTLWRHPTSGTLGLVPASQASPLKGGEKIGTLYPESKTPATPKVNTEPGWQPFTPESGTRNVPRAEMPQIKAEHRGAMVNFLAARGIKHEQMEVRASTLAPTQAEFSPERVQKARDFTEGDRSILVSKEGYILDGHHQWLAKLEKNEPVKVIRLDASINDLLNTVREFPSAELEGLQDASQTTQAGADGAQGQESQAPVQVDGSNAPAATAPRVRKPRASAVAQAPDAQPAQQPAADDRATGSADDSTADADPLRTALNAGFAKHSPAGLTDAQRAGLAKTADKLHRALVDGDAVALADILTPGNKVSRAVFEDLMPGAKLPRTIGRMKKFTEDLTKQIKAKVPEAERQPAPEPVITIKPNGDGQYLVRATVDGKVAGQMGLTVKTVGGHQVLSIDDIGVKDGYQGQGIGTMLYQHALDNLPTGIDGLMSEDATRQNTEQVPAIHSKLKSTGYGLDRIGGGVLLTAKGSKPPKSSGPSIEVIHVGDKQDEAKPLPAGEYKPGQEINHAGRKWRVTAVAHTGQEATIRSADGGGFVEHRVKIQQEKFHASISAAEDERKARGQSTHRIERDRRGLVVRPIPADELPPAPPPTPTKRGARPSMAAKDGDMVEAGANAARAGWRRLRPPPMFDGDPAPDLWIQGHDSVTGYKEPAAANPDALRAQADLQNALADIGDIFGKAARKTMMPEQEQKLLPVLTRLFDAAFRLGYHKFKDAARFALGKIREALGDDVADAVTLEHLQGAYIGMSGGKAGVDGIMDVAKITSKDAIEAADAPAAPAPAAEPKLVPPGKWFGTQDKADDYIKKRGLADTHQVVPVGRSRFEIQPKAKTAENASIPAGPGQTSLTDYLMSKPMPQDNPALRKLVEAYDRQEATPARMKEAQEVLEGVIVERAAKMVMHGNSNGSSTREIFDKLVALYNSQPLLNVRTSTSIENQAYSTPAPLAYVASRLAGIDGDTKVLEPTAGTGMLLMESDPKNAYVNELNDFRAALLQDQGYKVTQIDAASRELWAPGSMDAIITNPPFGSLKDDAGNTRKQPVDGYKIGQIDHLIAAHALTTMKDDGKAVLIIGANKIAGGRSNDDLVFMNWLYGNYNVHTHFEVDGKLYTRQGASWPVRVIAIDGRRKSDAVAPAEGTIERVYDWSDVYERYEQSLAASREVGRNPANDSVGADQQQAGARPVPQPAGKQTAGAGGRGSRRGDPGAGNVAGAGPGTVGDQRADAREPVGVSPDAQRGDEPAADGDRLDAAGEFQGTRAAVPAGNRGDDRLTTGENQFQTKYVARSARKDEGVLIPVNMADPLQAALDRLEDAVGDIDQFAAKELGYKSVAQMHESLMGLQVDSVASAIHQINSGKAIIIADQTGIGKGRQAAAIIRWAIKTGKVPVFVTVKPSLFTDMYGDLKDIGTDDARPFIVNLGESIKGDGDEKLFHTNTPAYRRSGIQALTAGELPKGSNAVFLTYSQINQENAQRGAITGIAGNAVFILDESHNAGGESATGDFVKSVLDLAKGTVYLSATYAKRPDNMPLYFKTDMGEAVADDETLMQAMESGGLPLQTVVSNNLVKAGQMFRRERSYDGVNIETKVDTARRQEHEELSDSTTQALRAIVSADRMFHEVFVKAMQKEASQAGGKVMDGAGNQAQASVDHTQFSSVVHNFVRQMLLGLNAQASADEAIAALKAGKKPLIALENTMGSFLAEYAENHGIKTGEALGQFDYRTVLSRALERTRYVQVQDAQGNKTKVYIPLAKLDPVTLKAYQAAQKIIDSLDIPIPVSPLDWIRQAITDAGYSVAEITGRNLRVDYSDKAKPTLDTVDMKEQKDKVNTTRRFNSGDLDAIILNVSGSTGISLHASEKFRDQRPRHMIVAQAAQDINIFMQMIGRVHRTGQVELPGYTILNADLPAVRRPTALLSGKMKSLNANTSSNTESATSVEALDMMNKYGDQVVGQYLADNPALAMAMGIPTPLNEEGKPAEDDLARKATGRLALMPVATQKQFYEDVEAQYATLIDYLNKTNQNELEPRTFDFDAKEMKREKIFEGSNPASPFGQDADYVEYSVKAQGKAMTPAEIQAEIDAHLGGKTPQQHREAIETAHVGDYNKLYASLPDEQKVPAHLVMTTGSNFAEAHQIGSMFRVDINGDQMNAVVTNLRNTHKKTGNPFALSKYQVTIAVNGSLRHLTVPGTQFANIEVSKLAQNYSLESLFKVQAETRDTAKIITGNLLGAYGELAGTKGTIISFTKEDGTTDLGVLLPKVFSMGENTRGGYRLRNGAEALRFLQESGARDIDKLGISTRDSVVRVTPNGGGILIRVPKSKSAGGKYFLDKHLLAVTGDFTSSGNHMLVTVSASKAPAAIDALMKKQAIYTMPSMAERAKEMFPSKAAFRQAANDGVDDQTPPPRGRTDLKDTARLQATADAITDKFSSKPQVVVTSSVLAPATPKAVQAEARRRIAKGGTPPSAVFYDGRVYLFADAIRTDAQAATSIAHEVLGHYGLRGNFGEALDGILKQIAATRPAQVSAMIRKNGMKASDRLAAAEEILAEMAEKQPDIGFVARAIAAIRTWLRENLPGLFGKTTLTDAEIIRNFILPARRFVESGQRSAPGAGVTTFSQGAQPFYSALEKGIEAMPDKPLARVGWEGAINSMINKGQIKADEVEWSGVKDWLATREGRIAKDEVLEFIVNNGVRVTEVQKGGAEDSGEAARRVALEDMSDEDFADEVYEILGFDPDDLDQNADGTIDRDDYIDKIIEDEGRDTSRDDGAGTTKYSQYTLPGGENYKELLLTLPVAPVSTEGWTATVGSKGASADIYRVNDRNGEYVDNPIARTPEEAIQKAAMTAGNKRHREAYKSSHWDEKNILAHIRLNDRESLSYTPANISDIEKRILGAMSNPNIKAANLGSGAPGLAVAKGAITKLEAAQYSHSRGFLNVDTTGAASKILFVEEIQSDWAQAGKKTGFAKDTTGWTAESLATDENPTPHWKVKDAQGNVVTNIVGPTKDGAINKAAEGVPAAPFVGKTDAWVTLALKRIVKMAVDGGYDRVAFVTGQQSADRYGLSKAVDKVEWFTRSGLKMVYAYPKNGSRVGGTVVDGKFANGSFPDRDVSEVLGAEIAAKIAAEADGELTGEGLAVGGAGMKAFYDKIVPAAANKLLAKVGGGKMATVTLPADGKTSGFHPTRAAAEAWVRENGVTEPVTYSREARYQNQYSVRGANGSMLVIPQTSQQAGFDITDAMREKAGPGLPMFSQSMRDETAVNNPRDYWKIGVDAMKEFNATPGKLHWWDESVGTPFHLAQRYPQFGAVFNRVQDFIRDVSLYATEAASLAPRILPKLETWSDIMKSALPAADTQALKAPVFEGTLTWARDQDGRPVKVKDLEDRYADLSEDGKAKMMLSRGRITEGDLKRWENLPIESYEGTIRNRFEREFLTAGVVWTDAELKDKFKLSPEQVSLYREFRAAVDRSITNLAISDMLRLAGQDAPQAVRDEVLATGDVMAASEFLREFLFQEAKAAPDRSGVLTDTAGRIHDKATAAQRLIDRGYAPLSRFGRYTVDVVDKDGERVYFGLFEGRIAARQMAARLQEQFPEATVRRGTTSEEQYKMFAGMTPETAELFGEMLGLDADGSGKPNVAFQKFLKEAKSSRSAMKRLIERKGIAGFSEDAGRVLAGFVSSNARQTAANLHQREIAALVQEVGKDADGRPQSGELKDAAIKLMNYVRNPQEEAVPFRAMLFAQYIGGSIASMLVNMTQPLQITMPYLSQYVGVVGAARVMRGALADAWNTSKTGDAELDAALNHAEEQGIVAPQEIHQLMAQAQGKGALKSGDGTMAGDAAATVNNAIEKLVVAWGKPFSMAELFNRRVTFVAAFRVAKAKGMPDPAKFAADTINQTQFVYNKGNKPQWARGAIGSTLFTFKTYSIGYMELMHRLYTQGGPEGKKAALFSLAMLMLMGGAGGLPFVQDIEDVVDAAAQRMGYNFSLKQARRQLLEDTLGTHAGQFLEKGVSGLPGVPLDVSGRFGMGNLIPGTGMLLKKTDHTRDVAELFGPAGDFTSRTFQAAGQIADGDPLKAAVTISPKAASNLAKAAEMATMGMYTDQRGRKVIDTDATDAVMKAIGFQPNDVARVQDATFNVQRRVAFARMTEAEIADEWAQAVFKKDQAAAQSAQKRLRDWNENNPDSPIKINFQTQVLRRVREMNKSKTERLQAASPKEMRSTVRRELEGK